MPAPFWSGAIGTLLFDLGTRPEGLSQLEPDRLRLRFGLNRVDFQHARSSYRGDVKRGGL